MAPSAQAGVSRSRRASPRWCGGISFDRRWPTTTRCRRWPGERTTTYRDSRLACLSTTANVSLPQSLDALLAQTYSDFELIISDNGSSDRTSEIAEQYQSVDPRVRYVRHDQNRGSTFNHNFVMEQARGEFFKWVSDDDLYAPELLQRCIEALDSRPEMVLAHAWTAFIDEDEQDH